LNRAISDFFKQEYQMLIGEQTSEKIKIEIGNALQENAPEKIVVSGKDTISGKSKTLEVSSNDILPSIRNVLNKLLVSIQEVLEESPSELVSDLSDRGIALSGGTSLLKNIDIFLTKSLEIPCYIVEDPLSCVVRGLSKHVDV
ncbi:rod shape-determining protein, partial [Candidatus Dojkabacteria bacterium]|nr:rod shape-determining protein [Candidatus Dojkabacteria bacterium]